MCSPACALIRPIRCQAIGAGSTALGISMPIAFTGDFCSTCSTSRAARAVGCSNALIMFSRLTQSGRFIRTHESYFVHRDPLRVLLSAARLTEVLRRPFTRHIDRAALGRQECERWSVGAELMIDAADREPFAEPIFHIRHRDLVGDPLGTIKNLYRHFGSDARRSRSGSHREVGGLQPQRRLRDQSLPVRYV